MSFQNLPKIQTERLILYLLNPNDIDIIFALRSNTEVQKYIQREPFQKLEEAELQIKKVLALIDNNESTIWVINLKSEAKKIGSICFWNFNNDRKTAEVGYDLLPEYHNKGIMGEALKAVLRFGFETLKLKTVEAYTSKHNKGSMALLEKNNFILEADRKDKGFPENIIYSLKH